MVQEGGGRDGGRVRDSGGGQPRSYADKLKTYVRFDQVLKRNVLDISLEGADPGNNNVESGDVQRLLSKLGIEIQTQVQGYQVHHGRPFHLEVWLAPGVNIDRFCKEDIIQVNKTVKTSYIRPAGRLSLIHI